MNDTSSSTAGSLPERIHIVGVGGAGASGSARLLARRGHRVSGYDRAHSGFLVGLAEQGIELQVGEERRPLDPDVGLVVRSAAVPEDDPDCAAARERGVPVWKYARLLGRLCPTGRTLAVAGTHGKTSVSWLLAYALRGLEHGWTTRAGALGAGADKAPNRGFLIGGSCQTLGVNAVAAAEGGWFALEACEYDRSFLQFGTTGAVITNVEADHLDYYGDLDAIERAFARFAARVDPRGLLVVGHDVPERVSAAARARVWRLGRELQVDYLAERRGSFRIKVRGPGWATPPLDLGVVGEFQAENAALALGLAIGRAATEWGLDPTRAAADAAREVARFRGAQRRFESWGSFDGREVIHDYAHHPTEIGVTLEAGRRAFPDRPLHVLFQPHQHSRTARLLGDFVESLRGVDHVVVSDVYGARVHIDHVGAGADELARRLRKCGTPARAGGDLTSSLQACLERLPSRAALFVLGAGDIDTLRDDLTRELALSGAATSRARV